MLSKKIAAIVFFFQDVMPKDDWNLFCRCMEKYKAHADQGATEWPDVNSGNPKMDALIQAIITDLDEENPNDTALAAGQDLSQYKGDVAVHAGGNKRVGCSRGGCGYYQYPGYWAYPWWSGYWYNQWMPYYWWNAYPIWGY